MFEAVRQNMTALNLKIPANQYYRYVRLFVPNTYQYQPVQPYSVSDYVH